MNVHTQLAAQLSTCISHTGYAVAANKFESFESSSRSLYVLGEVQCAGSEATLIECRASALGDAVSCSSFEVAGVFCPCKFVTES